MLHCSPDDFRGNNLCVSNIYTKHDDIEDLCITHLKGKLSYRCRNDLDIISFDSVLYDGAVDEKSSAFLQCSDELVERRAVHNDKVVHHIAERCTDKII